DSHHWTCDCAIGHRRARRANGIKIASVEIEIDRLSHYQRISWRDRQREKRSPDIRSASEAHACTRITGKGDAVNCDTDTIDGEVTATGVDNHDRTSIVPRAGLAQEELHSRTA